MQVNPEDSPLDIYVTWSNTRMTNFKIFKKKQNSSDHKGQQF